MAKRKPPSTGRKQPKAASGDKPAMMILDDPAEASELQIDLTGEGLKPGEPINLVDGETATSVRLPGESQETQPPADVHDAAFMATAAGRPIAGASTAANVKAAKTVLDGIQETTSRNGTMEPVDIPANVDGVIIKAPLYHEAIGTPRRRVDVKSLSIEQRNNLQRLVNGLQKCKIQLRDGSDIRTEQSAIKWVLEQMSGGEA